ncbi:hypothetical protein ACSHWB_45630 [Lentzea sp. HUAS TT2]|uniref:hypothetical protein n=1 Tax=Lentzea sp. HUAS TT2 TaxID=3447454 RepID=UPI003F704574
MTAPSDPGPNGSEQTGAEHTSAASSVDNVYAVRLRHDCGTITFTVGLASSPRSAVELVLAAEHAPRAAVKWVRLQPRCDYCANLATRYVRDSGDDTPLCWDCARTQHGGTARAAREATGKLGISRYIEIPEDSWATPPQQRSTADS